MYVELNHQFFFKLGTIRRIEEIVIEILKKKSYAITV